jgi:hypothetical protein
MDQVNVSIIDKMDCPGNGIKPILEKREREREEEKGQREMRNGHEKQTNVSFDF